MPHTRLDQPPATDHHATAHAPAVRVRGRRAWATWIGVAVGGLLTALALVQGLGGDVSAATLEAETTAAPDIAKLTPVGEVVQALPFL